MCYMNCPYERKFGPNVGECTLGNPIRYPADAFCVDEDMDPCASIDCENCERGGTHCGGMCIDSQWDHWKGVDDDEE